MKNAFYVKLCDAYIERVEDSTPVMLAALRDVQMLYMGGIRLALKTERAIEDRTRVRLPLTRAAGEFLEQAMPAAMDVQHDLATVSMNGGLNMVKSLRRKLAGPAASEGEQDGT